MWGGVGGVVEGMHACKCEICADPFPGSYTTICLILYIFTIT